MFSSTDDRVVEEGTGTQCDGGEATSRFDIRKLYDYQKRRSDHKKELYESLMHKVHHRIETVAQRQETQCFFQVPEFIVGKPLYDAYQCTGYMIQRLKDEGFVVQYAHPNTLYIDWTQHLIEPYVQEMDRREQRSGGNSTRRPSAPQGVSLRATPANSSTLPPAGNGGTGAASCPRYQPTGKLFGSGNGGGHV